MQNKKAQGFDTFKLLIAAVVAMVILGIITGVFSQVWSMLSGISCVSNPIGEITSKIQSATTGIDVSTQLLCFSNAGERIRADAISSKIASVGDDGVTFNCEGAAVCSGAGALISIDGDAIVANGPTQFKVLVHCEPEPSSGNYACTLTILNP